MCQPVQHIKTALSQNSTLKIRWGYSSVVKHTPVMQENLDSDSVLPASLRDLHNGQLKLI